MSVSHFTQLKCWQLANRLRGEVLAICEESRVKDDRRFCENFVAAAGSVPRNIAEGFARYGDGDIVKFFRYALASLAEVQDGFHECIARKALGKPKFDELWDLSEHTKATTTKFMKRHTDRLQASRAPRQGK